MCFLILIDRSSFFPTKTPLSVALLKYNQSEFLAKFILWQGANVLKNLLKCFKECK